MFPYGIKNFDVELNTICNANCSYCRIHLQEHSIDRPKEISEEILSQFYEKLCLNPPTDYYNIDFAETEPLLSFSLIKKMFKKYPIEVKNKFFHSITTNGKILNEEILQFCNEHRIIIKISIDGEPENCLKEKGIDLSKLKQLCLTCSDSKILAFNYVITQQRIDYLEKDLETVFSLANDIGGEWAFLLNVLEEWPEELFNQMIFKISNFLKYHYNTKLSYFLRSLKSQEIKMTGMNLRTDGSLGVMPGNHTCRAPIDNFYLNNFKNCGNIFSPNKDTIISYLNYYGEDFNLTSFHNDEKCENCVLKNMCNIENAKGEFIMSNEDCQAHIYNKMIQDNLSKTIIHYSDIKDNFRISGACLSLTNQCNMNCKYCFTEPNNEKMSLGTAIAAVMWIKEHQGKTNNTHINFFGGEPMLMYDEIIVPLITWAENAGITNITFGMTTNGTLLTPERIKWLDEHNVAILLSIDGGPETQNFNRPMKNGENSFDKIIDIIPTLLYYYPEVTFRSTIYPETVHLLYENYLWAKKLGFSSYFAMPDEYSEWSSKDKNTFVQEFQKIYWDQYQSVLDGTPGPFLHDFYKTIHKLIKLKDKNTADNEKEYLRCGLGTTSLGIGTNGDIYGCQEHLTYDHNSPFYLGNIFKNGIEENRHERLINMYSHSSIDRCPSHCWGLYENLNQESEINRIWRENKELTCLQIMFNAAENNDTIFKDYIVKTAGRGERL